MPQDRGLPFGSSNGLVCLADDDLREKARQALAEALEGDDEKRRFEAAKSLFSYRAETSLADRQDFADSHPRTKDGRFVVGLADVLLFAHELGELPPSVIEVCREIVAAQQAGPGHVDTATRSKVP